MITLQQGRFVECIDKETICLHPSSWRKTIDTMTPQEMLAKLMHHEVLDDEAKEALNQRKNIALTASHGSESSHCNKGCCEHKHKDDDDLDEEQAMLVGNYKNYL